MARVEGKQDTLRGEDSSKQIADRDSNPHRAALLGARHTHQSGESLRDLIEPRRITHRTAGAKTGDRASDDTRIAGRERFVLEAHRFHHAGTKIVDHHVGLVGQTEHHVAPGGCLRSICTLFLERLVLMKK